MNLSDSEKNAGRLDVRLPKLLFSARGEKTEPRIRLGLSLALLLALILFWGRPAEAEKILANLATKAGEVTILEKEGARKIVLQGEILYQGTAFTSVFRFLRPPKYDTLLLRDLTGPLHCPVQYRFLTLRLDKSHRLSPAFGHCAEPPEVTQKGSKIIIRFQGFGSMPPAAWEFDGQNLVQVEQGGGTQ